MEKANLFLSADSGRSRYCPHCHCGPDDSAGRKHHWVRQNSSVLKEKEYLIIQEEKLLLYFVLDWGNSYNNLRSRFFEPRLLEQFLSTFSSSTDQSFDKTSLFNRTNRQKTLQLNRPLSHVTIWSFFISPFVRAVGTPVLNLRTLNSFLSSTTLSSVAVHECKLCSDHLLKSLIWLLFPQDLLNYHVAICTVDARDFNSCTKLFSHL